MASVPGSISLPADAPDSRRSGRRIAVLIVWAWVAAACGLGICTFILLSLSAPWFGAVSLLLGIGALVRALSLRRKVAAARLGSARSVPDMPPGAVGSPIAGSPRPPLLAGTSPPALLDISDASPAVTAQAGSPRASSLSVGPDTGTRADADEFVGSIRAAARFTEHELQDLGLDRWEPDAYRRSADEGSPGIGLWIGVGIVVLIGVVVIRRRSARAKRAEVVADSAEESSSGVLFSSPNVAKIPQSSLGGGTDSLLSSAPNSTSAAPATDGLDAVVPPTTRGAPPQPRRLGRFTPSPTLPRFAVVLLLASFVLAYLAIRTAGGNTLSETIPLGIASFVALSVAFYLDPAS